MSLVLSVVLQEPAWPDLRDRRDDIIHEAGGAHMEITGLDGGMHSGKPSVAVRLDLENGKVLIAETSLALFLTAADALKARYGDPREEMP
jgi:hypothetical protein